MILWSTGTASSIRRHYLVYLLIIIIIIWFRVPFSTLRCFDQLMIVIYQLLSINFLITVLSPTQSRICNVSPRRLTQQKASWKSSWVQQPQKGKLELLLGIFLWLAFSRSLYLIPRYCLCTNMVSGRLRTKRLPIKIGVSHPNFIISVSTTHGGNWLYHFFVHSRTYFVYSSHCNLRLNCHGIVGIFLAPAKFCH